MPANVLQLHSFLGKLSRYRKFVRNLAKRLRPIPDLLKQHISYCFPPDMERIIRDVLHELHVSHMFIYPDRDAAIDDSRPS